MESAALAKIRVRNYCTGWLEESWQYRFKAVATRSEHRRKGGDSLRDLGICINLSVHTKPLSNRPLLFLSRRAVCDGMPN